MDKLLLQFWIFLQAMLYLKKLPKNYLVTDTLPDLDVLGIGYPITLPDFKHHTTLFFFHIFLLDPTMIPHKRDENFFYSNNPNSFFWAPQNHNCNVILFHFITALHVILYNFRIQIMLWVGLIIYKSPLYCYGLNSSGFTLGLCWYKYMWVFILILFKLQVLLILSLFLQ